MFRVEYVDNHETWREKRAKHWTKDKQKIKEQIKQLKENKYTDSESIKVIQMSDVTKEFEA